MNINGIKQGIADYGNTDAVQQEGDSDLQPKKVSKNQLIDMSDNSTGNEKDKEPRGSGTGRTIHVNGTLEIFDNIDSTSIICWVLIPFEKEV